MSTENDVLDTPSNEATGSQIAIPNSGGILTMGILSIVFAGGIGIVLGIIALSLSGGALTKYRENPSRYTESSFKNVKAGKICSIIGMSLAVLAIIVVIVAVNV